MDTQFQIDLLRELSLPDRYERLVEVLDAEVANLLVSPPQDTTNVINQISQEIRTRSEGVLIPLYAPSGTGKTTFIMNIAHWHPSHFAPTYLYQGPVEYDSLHNALNTYEQQLPADNRRIIPINVDHRESDPPNDRELATIKRFLRTNTLNAPCVIFWPETNRKTANQLAERYVNIAGRLSVDIPVVYSGPDQNVWNDIAVHTLSLANRIGDLEELGVNPHDYVPSEYHSIGEFLRAISHDFNLRLQSLREQLHKPIILVIAFATETPDPGILSQLTSTARYGLLDSHALISVTAQSRSGKWWAKRRGLLTRTIVQLNAHVVSVPPAATASCIRNFTDSMPLFDDVGYRRYGATKGARDLRRSDLGKILTGQQLSRFEARGTPAGEATAAFQLLSEEGFNLGKDKNLNGIMSKAVEKLLDEDDLEFEHVTSEKQLEFCNLIPDNAIHRKDSIICLEYTWRKGDFLTSSNRATAAQYILNKLQAYARQLEWTDA